MIGLPHSHINPPLHSDPVLAELLEHEDARRDWWEREDALRAKEAREFTGKREGEDA